MRPSLDEINHLLAEASETIVASEPAADCHDQPETPEEPPRVIHWRDRDRFSNVAYVGRAMPRQGLAGSPFANPYRVDVDGTRAEVIQKYREHILNRQELLQRLHELRGRPLACWCSPEACHADVLVELVDADAVLDELKAAAVRVEAREGRLRLSPRSAVDAALQARVAAHKPAILALLATRPPLPDATETWLAAVDRLATQQEVPPDVLVALKAAEAKWR